MTTDQAFRALDHFKIEIPSWGFANTGTRFGKYLQPAAATTLEEKFADGAEVLRLTGATPTLAMHVLWDLPNGLADVPRVLALAAKTGLRPGSINPNLFQAQEYKFGSLANPSAEIRARAQAHVAESIELARQLGVRDISLWLADGSNYPGTQSIRRRIDWLAESLANAHGHLDPAQRLLIEYKPFEPAFYHTDIADWGMALTLARAAGPQARVLVDTGHHYQGQNIEQIVAWLLHQQMLGGFHFNDRRYADDDLTLGSMDPYQVFRIFAELQSAQLDAAHLDTAAHHLPAEVSFMIDQSHNLKGKIEATVQTVSTAQELWAKAALIDYAALARLQDGCDLVAAEEHYRAAFWTDVRPTVAAWREAHNLPTDPLAALRASDYVEQAAATRQAHRKSDGGYA